MLTAGFLMSASPGRHPMSSARGERERRVSLSFSYVLAGMIVIAIGVAIEASR